MGGEAVCVLSEGLMAHLANPFGSKKDRQVAEPEWKWECWNVWETFKTFDELSLKFRR